MSEHDDDLLARRYRELRREVPSAALDKKVLTAARSAVTPRSFARRWAAPLAAAAVLVLAVGVTMQVQREEAKRAAGGKEAATARAKTSAEPARLASASPGSPASPAAGVPAPSAASAEAPREIPFSPRRPLEPSSAAAANVAAPAAPASAGAAAVGSTAPAVPGAAAPAVPGFASPVPGGTPGAAKITAPPFGDIARAQREASQAVAGFGVLSGGAPTGSSASGAPAADNSGTGAMAGPFSIDQATSTGAQVRLVQPR